MYAEPFVSPILSEGRRVILGEGPLILGDQLMTTDARRSLLRCTDLRSGATQDIDLGQILRDTGLIAKDAADPVLGSIAPAKDGTLLAAMATGIYRFDPERRTLSEFAHPEQERRQSGSFYNDGKVGPDGAFYVGGMLGAEGAGRLLRIDPDRSHSEPLRGEPPLTTPNGLHWFGTDSPDVWDFYYVCSQYPAIQHYRHTLSTCEMHRQPDLIALPRETFGYLDGMTGTSNRLLLLALYAPPKQFGCIAVDTRTGEIVDRIDTGVPQTTSVAMRGEEIYLTSAAQEYRQADFETYPNAGAIFRCLASDAESELLRAAREDTVAGGFRFG